MKFTKSYLKQVIQEELQKEIFGFGKKKEPAYKVGHKQQQTDFKKVDLTGALAEFKSVIDSIFTGSKEGRNTDWRNALRKCFTKNPSLFISGLLGQGKTLNENVKRNREAFATYWAQEQRKVGSHGSAHSLFGDSELGKGAEDARFARTNPIRPEYADKQTADRSNWAGPGSPSFDYKGGTGKYGDLMRAFELLSVRGLPADKNPTKLNFIEMLGHESRETLSYYEEYLQNDPYFEKRRTYRRDTLGER